MPAEGASGVGTEDLIACRPVVEGDSAVGGNKPGVTRLECALLLKFFEVQARFPRRYVARQVRVDPARPAMGREDDQLPPRQIREAFGLRAPPVGVPAAGRTPAERRAQTMRWA